MMMMMMMMMISHIGTPPYMTAGRLDNNLKHLETVTRMVAFSRVRL